VLLLYDEVYGVGHCVWGCGCYVLSGCGWIHLWYSEGDDIYARLVSSKKVFLLSRAWAGITLWLDFHGLSKKSWQACRRKHRCLLKCIGYSKYNTSFWFISRLNCSSRTVRGQRKRGKGPEGLWCYKLSNTCPSFCSLCKSYISFLLSFSLLVISFLPCRYINCFHHTLKDYHRFYNRCHVPNFLHNQDKEFFWWATVFQDTNISIVLVEKTLVHAPRASRLDPLAIRRVPNLGLVTGVAERRWRSAWLSHSPINSSIYCSWSLLKFESLLQFKTSIQSPTSQFLRFQTVSPSLKICHSYFMPHDQPWPHALWLQARRH